MYDVENDNSLIAFALDIWANYIETFCVSMSAKNAIQRNKEPNFLTSKQKQLVDRLHLLSEIYKNKNPVNTLSYELIYPTKFTLFTKDEIPTYDTLPD